MQNQIQLTKSLDRVHDSLNRSPWRRGVLLIPFALASFALSPAARAVDPPPDGGYPVENTAEGEDALFSLTTGASDTAIGFHALHSVTTGVENTAIGANALGLNTTGIFNTATGDDTLSGNTTGNTNTADGWNAMIANTTGSNNTSVGCDSLKSNSTGQRNIALGFQAGGTITGSYNIAIGNIGVPGESRAIRIGTNQAHRATYIAGISGAIVPNGIGVIIDTDGHLGTIVSSERFKDNVQPMDKASEAVLALQPVTFRYKHELDPDGISQFGLVAEQVEKVDPNLVARDSEGKAYTVRYEAVNAMLLNEFLKDHRKMAKLEATVTAQQKGLELERQQAQATATQQQSDFQSTITQQQKQIEALTAALKTQAFQIQKVNDAVRLRKTTKF